MSTTIDLAQPFFVTGGALKEDSPSYLLRPADEEIVEYLQKGELCYILCSRQVGKTSIVVRAARKLREEGGTVILLDLSQIGKPDSPDKWYYGLIFSIGRKLADAGIDCQRELRDHWRSNSDLSPYLRWRDALINIILPRIPTALVIVLDKIDSVRLLSYFPATTDEFFAGMRECYNLRATQPLMRRLTFCLVGTATTADLIGNPDLAPFNIGKGLVLGDFTRQEIDPLRLGFSTIPPALVGKVLDRIYYWTHGHPYLTQSLCQAIMNAGYDISVEAVDRACETLFLKQSEQLTDTNLKLVSGRMLRSRQPERVKALLDLYERVLRGKSVRKDETNRLMMTMILSGIVRNENGYLKVRNRIYAHVFDQNWIRTSTPPEILELERRARRKTLIEFGAIAGVIFVIMLCLLLYMIYILWFSKTHG